MLTVNRDEAGSMPLVILASIIVLGLVTVLFASALTSQRVTRFDQDFTTAFHGADSALQAGLAAVRNADPNGLVDPATNPEVVDSDQTGDVSYSYRAVKVGSEWRVRAEGTRRGTTRYLEATLTRPSRFQTAAFGKTLVGMKGDNGAASYNGSSANTGNGAVGTNGQIELIGGGYADELQLYGPTAECAKTPDNCNDMLDKTVQSPNPYEFETEFIAQALDSDWCQASIDAYVASVDGPLVGGAGDGPDGEYCFTSVNFDVSTTLDVSAGPVIVYVSDRVESANDVTTNCPGCIDRGFDSSTNVSKTSPAMTSLLSSSDAPVAADLQIFSFGEIRLGNHNYFSGAIYAPNDTCRGNPSVAQTTIFGSVVCGQILNQGGWMFWYDERLAEVGGGLWRIDGIREESQGSTSF